jgi:dephospho-CoA kinase
MRPMLRLGLTGGIGSGKSTVAGMLVAWGAALVDADVIARQLTAPGGAALPEIACQFGAEFVTTSGALDRDRMRALAFTDPAARQRLEAIIHPLVGREVLAQTLAAQQAGRRCTVFDIPLLVESGRWRQQLDRVLVVDCSHDLQCERVMARSQLSRAGVEAIIAAQASRERRLAAADMVIFNQGLNLAQLSGEVLQLATGFGLSCGQRMTEEYTA